LDSIFVHTQLKNKLKIQHGGIEPP